MKILLRIKVTFIGKYIKEKNTSLRIIKLIIKKGENYYKTSRIIKVQ